MSNLQEALLRFTQALGLPPNCTKITLTLLPHTEPIVEAEILALPGNLNAAADELRTWKLVPTNEVKNEPIR